MNAAALPYIVQIAVFGAAGTSFVSAHLKNLAADRLMKGVTAADRWRMFRFPHRRGPDRPEALKLRRAALVQTLWGAAFLLGAFAIQALAGAPHQT